MALTWETKLWINLAIIEGSLEVKLPTIWTDEAAEAGTVREEKGRRENKPT